MARKEKNQVQKSEQLFKKRDSASKQKLHFDKKIRAATTATTLENKSFVQAKNTEPY